MHPKIDPPQQNKAKNLPNAESLVGIGLRAPHLDQMVVEKPSVGWLEIHTENYFEPTSFAYHRLLEIAESYPISMHCIGHSLGTAGPLNYDHIGQVHDLVKTLTPLFLSDHLSWSALDGQYFNDLLPVPYQPQSLQLFVEKVDQLQQIYQRQILIENPSLYVNLQDQSTINEWEFFNELCARTGCGILLDINNLQVNEANVGLKIHDYLRGLDIAHVQEIHLAGCTKKNLEDGRDIWIDDHGSEVSDSCWSLYQNFVTTHGPRATLIEWDTDVPELDVLLDQQAKAVNILKGINEPSHNQSMAQIVDP